MAKSYIALGSNIGDPIANVKKAIKELSAIGRLCACSSLYSTKPWGYLDQPDFINAVIGIETNLTPQQLLEKLQIIEKNMGRTKTIRWGPRLIDLDILTFADQEVKETNLTIPHPHMLERAFVLAPLAEIDNSYLEFLEKISEDLRKEIVQLQK